MGLGKTNSVRPQIEFVPLESYGLEGGVTKGNYYSCNEFQSNAMIYHRLATSIEIETFLSDGSLDNVKAFERNKKIDNILE